MKHYEVLVFISTLFAFFACGLPQPSRPTVANTTESLTLSLEASKDVYQLSEPVYVSLAIANASNFDLVIKNRMAVNTWSEAITRRDVVFIVKMPSGSISSYRPRSHVNIVENSDFILLAPGEIVEHTYDLSSLYNIDEYGAYSAFAIYQNSSDPSDGVAWRGELVSNVILFTINP